MNPEIEQALSEIVANHCHCDAMIGYECGIHAEVASLRNLIKNESDRSQKDANLTAKTDPKL
jgi:hypothetical protein